MLDDDILANLPPIETDRLLLRRMRPADLHDLYDHASDPHMTAYLSWEPHRSLTDSHAFLQDVIGRYARGELAPWGVEERAEGTLIGTCGFVSWYRHDARAEVAYALSRPYWGRGLATEALRAVITFGFAAMGLNRIEARCLVENRASARVMEKAGMQLEGVLREQLLIKGAYRDLTMYSILRKEHEQRRGE